MIKKNSNQIWRSISQLGETLQKGYSVTDAKTIKKQYLTQVKQYPLYLSWFKKIEQVINKNEQPVELVEYGPGPGLLARKLVRNKWVKKYTAVEPGKIFREMTHRETRGKATVLKGLGETYHHSNCFDVVVATATYHHFCDKPTAVRNFYKNLKRGGLLIIAEAFIPKYKFDHKYNPTDKAEFTENVLNYAAAQILSMPRPSQADITDQVKTAIILT